MKRYSVKIYVMIINVTGKRVQIEKTGCWKVTNRIGILMYIEVLEHTYFRNEQSKI